MLQRLLHVSLALVALAAASCAPSVATTPHLVSAWPAQGAVLSLKRHIFELTFNHVLSADASWAAVYRDDAASVLETEALVDPADGRRFKVRVLQPVAGAYQLHWHVVDAHSGAASDGGQTFGLQDESPKPARLDLSPARVDKGETVSVVGKGFAPRSAIQLTIADDEQPLATAQTDEAGKFSVDTKVPASVPFGVQPVSAADASGRRATGAVEVRWGGWPPVVATIVGQPGSDTGDVTFTVNVRNGSDYLVEHVRLVLADPENGVLVGADPAPRREVQSLVWIIPVMDRGVVGPFRATYRTGRPSIGKVWLEFRHRHIGPCVDDECLPAFISESVAESQLVAPAD